MRKGLVGIGVVVAAGGLSVALYSKSNSQKDKGFKTVPVTRGPLVEKALAIGAIKPKHEITVKSKISGIVKISYHLVGDKVKAGDPLFDIIPDPTPLELTEARREVESSRNVFDQAKKKWDRNNALRQQGIVSSQDWEVTDKELQEAQIHLNLSEERLALVEKGRVRDQQLNVESIIRAPITGTVLELLVNPGDPVVPLTSYQAGTPLTSLADMSDLIFKGTVDEIDVGKLKEGMAAHIKVGALPEAKVEGRVSNIAPKSKTAEGATLFDVEIELLPGKDVVLRAGYSANGEIAVREKADVLLIPERLITFKDGKATVEVPGKDEAETVKREIKTGLSDGMTVEVADGLKEKDLVVERPPKKIE
jgi:HlyD family secretion protein